MDWLHLTILALIQGLTEFLPISSSAHLILPSQVLGWPDQGLAFDVAVHLGTLIAVVSYFRKEVGAIALGGLQSLSGQMTDDGRMAWMLLVATLPAALCGLLFDDFIETNLRSSLVIAVTTLLGAGLLWLADRQPDRIHSVAAIGWRVALLVGLAQALALIPGTSRSGITITMALLLGCSRDASARFSFLLAIPVILLSAGWQGLKLAGEPQTDWSVILVAMSLSALSAFACIHLFLGAIRRIGMLPFVLYRLVLGLVLLLFFV